MDAPSFRHPIHGWVKMHYDEFEDDNIILEDYQEDDAMADPLTEQTMDLEINQECNTSIVRAQNPDQLFAMEEEASTIKKVHLANTLFDRVPKEIYNRIGLFLPMSFDIKNQVLINSFKTMQALYGSNQSNLFENIYPEFIKCHKISLQILANMLSYEEVLTLCPHLEYIDLRHFTYFSREATLQLLPICKKAKNLLLFNIDEEHLFRVRHLVGLRSLTLENILLCNKSNGLQITKKGLASLTHLINLQSLSLSGDFGYSSHLTPLIAKLTNLQHLSFNHSFLQSSDLYELALLTSLEELNITQSYSFSSSGIEDLKETLPSLKLQINGCPK